LVKSSGEDLLSRATMSEALPLAWTTTLVHICRRILCWWSVLLWHESCDAKFCYSQILLNLDAVELHGSRRNEKWWANNLLHPALLCARSMICLSNWAWDCCHKLICLWFAVIRSAIHPKAWKLSYRVSAKFWFQYYCVWVACCLCCRFISGNVAFVTRLCDSCERYSTFSPHLDLAQQAHKANCNNVQLFRFRPFPIVLALVPSVWNIVACQFVMRQSIMSSVLTLVLRSYQAIPFELSWS
jgi:hypothetical protein